MLLLVNSSTQYLTSAEGFLNVGYSTVHTVMESVEETVRCQVNDDGKNVPINST